MSSCHCKCKRESIWEVVRKNIVFLKDVIFNQNVRINGDLTLGGRLLDASSNVLIDTNIERNPCRLEFIFTSSLPLSSECVGLITDIAAIRTFHVTLPPGISDGIYRLRNNSLLVSGDVQRSVNNPDNPIPIPRNSIVTITIENGAVVEQTITTISLTAPTHIITSDTPLSSLQLSGSAAIIALIVTVHAVIDLDNIHPDVGATHIFVLNRSGTTIQVTIPISGGSESFPLENGKDVDVLLARRDANTLYSSVNFRTGV